MAITACALLAALLPAVASARDRNRDRIPDRWERHHHLSLKVKQTRRDQDADGLNNLREWRNHTDPRDDDSDDDGIEDGDENAGTVDSFDANTGVLVIKLAKDGSLVTGTVTSGTEIECEGAPTAAASHDGDDDDNSGPGGADDHGDDDDQGEDEHECGTEALVEGANVHEAELKLDGGTATWREVELRS